MADRDDAAGGQHRHPLVLALWPLSVDVGLPLVLTQLALHGFGMGLVGAMTVGGIVPLLRSVAPLATRQGVNTLAALMLATTMAGLVLGALAGDAG